MIPTRKFFLAFLSVVFLTSGRFVNACFSDSDCDNYDEVCCNGYCQDSYYDCSCSSRMDCPSSQYCCDGSCSWDESCGYLDPGAVAGIIVGSIFLIIVVVMISLCICGCVCAAGPFRNRGRGGVVRGPNYGTTATTVVTSSTAGTTNPTYPQYPPYPGQPRQYPPAQYPQQPGQYPQQPGQYPQQPGQYPPQYGQNFASGYQSFPPNQAPPPYLEYPGQTVGGQVPGQAPVNTENMEKQTAYAAPPAVNPHHV